MALLFKYPLTLGSNNEEEGNHHIITFVALKYNENRGKDSLGDEVNLYITGDALKSTYGQTYADVGMGAVGGFLMQSKGTEDVYKAIEGAVGSAAGFDLGGIIKNISGFNFSAKKKIKLIIFSSFIYSDHQPDFSFSSFINSIFAISSLLVLIISSSFSF